MTKIYTFIFALIITTNTLAQLKWSELGNISTVDADGFPINSICLDSKGNLYAAGFFGNASGNHFVAKWDGSNWSELGGTNGLVANGTIYSLCVDSKDNIYAAGNFTYQNRRYVVKWNGAKWSVVTSLTKLDSVSNGLIRNVCIGAGDTLYASGDFLDSNKQSFLAKWNGTDWVSTGLTNVYGAGGIFKMSADKSGNIYVTGGSNQLGLLNPVTKKADVGKWDGTKATFLGLNSQYKILSMSVDTFKHVYVGGALVIPGSGNQLAKYDTAWSFVSGFPAIANAAVGAIATDDSGNVYVGGRFTHDSPWISSGLRFVAKYDGTSWSELGGNNSLAANDDITCILPDNKGNVYVAGAFKNSSKVCYVAKYGSIITSINNNYTSANKYSIYPNPNNGRFTINKPSIVNCNLSIIDILGNECYSFTLINENTSIDLSTVVKGIYIAKFTSLDGVITNNKLIVE